MHSSVLAFVAETVQEYDLFDCSVLDVGSLNVNGSAREMFHDAYHGIDMQEGPGVDEVLNAHDIASRYRVCFDVIVCTEMLEHDDLPWVSLDAMRVAARPGGMLLLTCRGYDERGCFPVHGYPEDFYRYSCEAVRRLLLHTGWIVERVEPDPEAPGVFALARR